MVNANDTLLPARKEDYRSRALPTQVTPTLLLADARMNYAAAAAAALLGVHDSMFHIGLMERARKKW